MPKVEKGKIIVIRADLLSGIILTNDGSYYIGEGNDYYLIFDSLGEAKSFAQTNKKLGDVQLEIILHDHNGIYIEHIQHFDE